MARAWGINFILRQVESKGASDAVFTADGAGT